MAGPLIIRLSQVAELIGCSTVTLRRHCRTAGAELLQVGSVAGAPRGPLYMTIAGAAGIAAAVLGRRADAAFRDRARRAARKQREAHGAFRTVRTPEGWGYPRVDPRAIAGAYSLSRIFYQSRLLATLLPCPGLSSQPGFLAHCFQF
jgi:hypothetical protein